MNLDKFVDDAIRTESKPKEISLNPEAFAQLRQVLIDLGSVLDQVKKNAFYKKPFNIYSMRAHIDSAKAALQELDRLVAKYDFPNIETDKVVKVNPRIFHSIVGVTTEAVELLQALDINSNTTDEVNLREEFGDIMWYLAIGVSETGGDFNGVVDKVIAKLRARFPEKFTNENAINRDLATERKILES